MSEQKKGGGFGVIADPQSYLNIVYLLIALPLGTFYFVFLVTGLSLGFGLFITLLGIPVLLLVLGGSSLLCSFERYLAITLLKEDIPATYSQPTTPGLWSRLKMHLSNRLTWTGIIYLLLKFPIGIATFTIAITMLAVSVGFVFAPAYLWTSNTLVWGNWVFDPYPWAWILTAIGIPMVFVSLHFMNAAAMAFGGMTRIMLGKLQ